MKAQKEIREIKTRQFNDSKRITKIGAPFQIENRLLDHWSKLTLRSCHKLSFNIFGSVYGSMSMLFCITRDLFDNHSIYTVFAQNNFVIS